MAETDPELPLAPPFIGGSLIHPIPFHSIGTDGPTRRMLIKSRWADNGCHSLAPRASSSCPAPTLSPGRAFRFSHQIALSVWLRRRGPLSPFLPFLSQTHSCERPPPPPLHSPGRTHRSPPIKALFLCVTRWIWARGGVAPAAPAAVCESGVTLASPGVRLQYPPRAGTVRPAGQAARDRRTTTPLAVTPYWRVRVALGSPAPPRLGRGQVRTTALVGSAPAAPGDRATLPANPGCERHCDIKFSSPLR